MLKKVLPIVSALLVVALGFVITSCGGTSSENAPDPLTIKSQDNVYTEATPSRTQLQDSSGNPIKAWFDLHYVNVVNRGGCTPACLDFSVDIGADPQSNPNVIVTITCGFSEDGSNFVYVSGTTLTSCGGGIPQNTSSTVTRTLSIPGNPAYFLVKGNYPADTASGVITRPGGDGSAVIKFR